MATASLLLAVLFCLAVVQPGVALRCWVCSSTNDAMCRDAFNGTRSGRVDCTQTRSIGFSSDYTYCQKMVTTIPGGEPRVVRKCVYSREPLTSGACFDHNPRDNDHYTVQHCSTCDSDLCNAAAAPPGPAALAFAAAALAASWGVARLLR